MSGLAQDTATIAERTAKTDEVISMESSDSSLPDSVDSNITAKPKKRTKRMRVRSPETLHKIKKTRRSKANNRERNRMHDLNSALDELRVMLPQSEEETKLTKIETLRYVN